MKSNAPEPHAASSVRPNESQSSRDQKKRRSEYACETCDATTPRCHISAKGNSVDKTTSTSAVRHTFTFEFTSPLFELVRLNPCTQRSGHSFAHSLRVYCVCLSCSLARSRSGQFEKQVFVRQQCVCAAIWCVFVFSMSRYFDQSVHKNAVRFTSNYLKKYRNLWIQQHTQCVCFCCEIERSEKKAKNCCSISHQSDCVCTTAITVSLPRQTVDAHNYPSRYPELKLKPQKETENFVSFLTFHRFGLSVFFGWVKTNLTHFHIIHQWTWTTCKRKKEI